jgi:hypothetical protein
MSDLYRSAIGARLSKLPNLPPLASSEDDGPEADETADSVGSLPGSGMGPPAMQVVTFYLHNNTHIIIQGRLVMRAHEGLPMQLMRLYQPLGSLPKQHSLRCWPPNSMSEFIIPHLKSRMGQERLWYAIMALELQALALRASRRR